MRPWVLSTLVALLLFFGFAPAAVAAGQAQVSMHDGVVSVSASGATLADILDAWTRAGHTEFVNADKLGPTAPLTLEISSMSEGDALNLLLGSLSGYLALVREQPDSRLSRFARVILLPSSVSHADSAVLNTPSQSAAPPFAAAQQQSVIVNGVARLVGPDGALVEDDQQGAPRANSTPGFSRGDAPPMNPTQSRPSAPAAPGAGSSAPGMAVPPAAPNSPATPVQR